MNTRFLTPSFLQRLRHELRQLCPLPMNAEAAVAGLQRLVKSGFGDLPQPGAGSTLLRWQALAAVAATDLSLLKLYEGHTDALAILAELGHTAPTGTWAVWAAEPPDAFLAYDGEHGQLSGSKPWCSGCEHVSHALVTAKRNGAPVLVRVDMDQARIRRDVERWHAIGMAATRSGEVIFDKALATQMGQNGAYLERPGFWHGAMGIAACWHGAACAIAETLRSSPRLAKDPHARAHLGGIDGALHASRCVLRQAAEDVDAQPSRDAQTLALRVRSTVEAVATLTMARVGRALGAAPLCLDAAHGRRCADLSTFMRQSHAERDLEALGSRGARTPPDWNL